MHLDKYSASGNDFVIFHAFAPKDRSALAKRLCHRQEGVGADGLIVLLPHESCDFAWEFYNSDGSLAAMCGNGSRACAHYALTHGLAPSSMRFMTGAGQIASCVDGAMVESQLTPAKEVRPPFEEAGARWYFFDTGVPHLVTFDLPFEGKLAKQMRETYNANVNFCVYDKALHVRTYERGVEAETGACGTGMVAAFLSAHTYLGGLEVMDVFPSSKEHLQVRIDAARNLYLKGAVRRIFSTHILEDV